MDPTAGKALRRIQDCVAHGRYRVLAHFIHRMDVRGLFWPDVRSVIDSPDAVEDDGTDRFGRAKWRLCGKTSDGLKLGIVCAMDRDRRGRLTVFITAYWE